MRDAANQLVGAECYYLTGGRPDADGVASGTHVQALTGAAYGQAAVEVLAQAASFAQLVDQVRALKVRGRDFRIEFRRFPQAQPIGQRQAIVEVANCLDGAPKLDEPKERYYLVGQKGGWWFGRLVGEPDRRYNRHDGKPCRTSSSLPSRLARGLVNLVRNSAESILDPCCGTGSILLEASALGLVSYGLDWNEKMVAMSRQNALYFNYATIVEQGDARQWDRRGGAVVTDLPYGKNLEVSPQVIQGILSRGARLAPVGVYAAGADLSAWLTDGGYGAIETYQVAKSAVFSRYIHRAESVVFR